MGKKNKEADEIAAVEIYNHIMNPGTPLHERFKFFVIIYNKKVRKGIFDEKLAVKGFLNLVNAGWSSYKKEYYKPESKATLDMATKLVVAKMLLKEYNANWKGKPVPSKKKNAAKNRSNEEESWKEDEPELQIETGAYVINDEGVFQYGNFLGKFPNDEAAYRFIRQRMDKEKFWPNVFYAGERGDVDVDPGWGKFWDKWEARLAGKPHEMELYLDANQTGDNSAWIGEITKGGDVRFTIIQDLGDGFQVADVSVDKSVATDLNDDNVKQVISQLSDMNAKKWLALHPERRAYLLASSNPFGPEEYMDNDPREYKSLKAALREEGLLDYEDELAF